VGRREASAQRSARAAPERCGGWIRVCRRSASLLSFRSYISWLEAQIVRIPVATAGILWRRSGRRAKKFLPRDDDSGANRIARTRRPCFIRPRDSGGGGPSVARSAKDGGGGAGREEISDASGEASMQRPAHRASARSPLPTTVGRDEKNGLTPKRGRCRIWRKAHRRRLRRSSYLPAARSMPSARRGLPDRCRPASCRRRPCAPPWSAVAAP
jgi:hypothetical protein